MRAGRPRAKSQPAALTTRFRERTVSTRALDCRDLGRMVSEAARRAGIKFTVTPHTLRHSFATRFLAKNQGDIATLATILGHANISTATRYLHPNARRVQEMVEEM